MPLPFSPSGHSPEQRAGYTKIVTVEVPCISGKSYTASAIQYTNGYKELFVYPTIPGSPGIHDAMSLPSDLQINPGIVSLQAREVINFTCRTNGCATRPMCGSIQIRK